jgi:cyclophilin family peptidyl-prolyl cis-trans isomerase
MRAPSPWRGRRTGVRHREFFINLVDNPGLNQDPNDTENRTGYAVFGRVVTAWRRSISSRSSRSAAVTGRFPERSA